MPRITQADLNKVAKTFEDCSPADLIRWASVTFGSRLAAISAMQQSGSILSHMISSLGLNIPILFVDTGVMFQETLTTRDRIVSEYGVNVRTLHPELTMVQQTEKYGVLYLTPEGQRDCCHMRKVEPLLRMKGEYDALMGSLRRADGGRRGDCPLLAIDTEMNAIRINPLANFSDEALEDYLATHPVIVNPLHSQGFSTIGCNRCTTPVLPGEPKRAGRWRHLGPWSMYCGINPTDVDDGSSTAAELPQDLIDRIMGQKTDFMI